MLSAKQLRMRASGLGSSEIAAVIGISPWSQPIDVYRRKHGLEPAKSAAHLTAGNMLEDAIARWAAKDQGWTLRRCNQTIAHLRERWVLATPDRFVIKHRCRDSVAEIKTTNSGDGWGPAGTDQVPDYYRTQVQWQLTVLRSRQPHIEVAYVVCFFLSSREVRVYVVRHSDELERALLDAGREFWYDRVLAQDPPLDDPRQDGVHKYLADVLKQRSTLMRQAPPEAARWASVLHEARVRRELAEADAKEAEAYLKAWVGEDKGIQGPWGRYSWSERAGGNQWKEIAEELFTRLDMSDEERAKVVANHKLSSTRSARFTPNDDYFAEQK